MLILINTEQVILKKGFFQDPFFEINIFISAKTIF